MNRFRLICVLLALSCTACTWQIPSPVESLEEQPDCTPSYDGVTVPYNIAPLNMRIRTQAKGYRTQILGQNGTPLVCNGPIVRIPVDKWHRLLETNKGERVVFRVFLKTERGWVQCKDIPVFVSEDPVDGYLSYRLIEPGYTGYGQMGIYQRSVTDFNVRTIYDNNLSAQRTHNQCINCHSYQNYGTNAMSFHAREYKGGTIIVNNGQVTKVNIKNDSLLSNGVYPSWHPTEGLIAFSVNITSQFFFVQDPQYVEVQDSNSDIVLYDVQTQQVLPAAANPQCMETFPCWSPDGAYLYYASAPVIDSVAKGLQNVATVYDRIRYNLMRVPFDASTRRFGPPDTVYLAAAQQQSVSTPRVSPSGRYVVSAVAPFGTFHIWHQESDLYLTDLQTGTTRPIEGLNSPQAESFHAWSSNGRWLVFASRRDQGTYTRLYIGHIDQDGVASKPFVLPQKNPDSNHTLFKSYNVPEFTKEPVRITPNRFWRVIRN